MKKSSLIKNSPLEIFNLINITIINNHNKYKQILLEN